MRVNKLFFVFLIAAFACEGPLGFNDPQPIDGGGGIDVPDKPGGGINPPPPPPTPPPPPPVPVTAQEFYNTGYAIGTSDADWLVAQTWQAGTCVAVSFEIKTEKVRVRYTVHGGNLILARIFTPTVYRLKRNSFTCPTTTLTQELAFDNFISIYPHQVGYIQILEDQIDSTILNDKAFYEGVLAGFKNRLCGWSINMPFNFTNCDAVDLPGSTTVIGGPSGGGPTLCPSCPS
ncbi:MAG: hypothetical protein AAGA64_15025 [Bacteroidota bacterium]